ncbi:heavy metal-responsive transcriptional regulator [Vineibacter terrae]|uniref:Heavy metal-responsive transcriptional regulator n=1 Tax=Vineibacter terrae TaxID=2586908 RepID=A0A5C8PTV3_9HYPH|nr:heavy metal-responsive transcriptional regulator [Vineibacter terrae]TXL80391.1 heavy metal-responsive transcriptional regulator [Vineibacter terrae]
MLTIGKLAARAHVTPDTLRYYEREGLIEPPEKSAAGYRLYGDDDVVRLHFIRQAQDCGFTLAEIRTLLSLRSREAACCGEVRALAVAKNRQLAARIKAMRAMTRTLDRLIAACDDTGRPIDRCPILSAFNGTPR